MQTIVITGRLAKDAETRRAGDNDVVCFDVAVDQGYGDRKVTNWYRCQMWGKRGTSVQPYLLKGSNVTVSGELETSMYNDKLQLGIQVSQVQLPPKPQGQREPSRGAVEGRRGETGGGAGGYRAPFDSDLDDDVPFVTHGCPFAS